MNNITSRKTLVVAGLTTALTLGVAGCDGSNDSNETSDASMNMGTTISDTAITAGIKANLAVEPLHEDSDISVTTSNGVVTLSGTVMSAEAKSKAESLATSIAGVKSVRNNLGTVPSEPTEPVARAVSDTWITTKVKAELLADSMSSAYEVGVKTKDGWVELSGSLETRGAVDHARDIARAVDGVRGVDTSALLINASR